MLIDYAQAYTLEYHDCHDISKLRTYKVSKACNKTQNDDQIPTTYTILQHKSIQFVEGWSCKITRSQFTDYCGSFGHSKVIKTPEIEVSHAPSVNDCWDMIVSKRYVTADGIHREIILDAENILSVEEIGTINIGDDFVTCHGQPAKIGNFVIEDVLEIAQYKVTVKRQRYKAKGQKMEVAAGHLLLPNTCGTDTHGCQLTDVTYVWEHPLLDCPLEAAQTVSMTNHNGYLKSQEFNIILRKGDKTTPPERCPQFNIYKTEYKDIFLTKPNDQWPAMTSDLNFADYVAARDDFIMSELEDKMINIDKEFRETICKETLLKQGEIVRMNEQSNTFYRRNGDALESFECPRKIGNIATELDACYQDIPLANGKGFVKPSTRLYTSHSAAVPCNQHYGLKIETAEELWVELNPKLKQIGEPPARPNQQHLTEHKDMSGGGLFTNSELQAWRNHLELGDIHDALAKGITYSVCREEGMAACGQGTFPHSNVRFTNPDILKLTESWNIFKRLDNFIKRMGGYVSLIVIIIETMRFVSFTAAIAMTTMRDGLDGLKALSWILCCHAHHTATRIRRRSRRLNQRKAQDSDDDTEQIGLSFVAT